MQATASASPTPSPEAAATCRWATIQSLRKLERETTVAGKAASVFRLAQANSSRRFIHSSLGTILLRGARALSHAPEATDAPELAALPRAEPNPTSRLPPLQTTAGAFTTASELLQPPSLLTALPVQHANNPMNMQAGPVVESGAHGGAGAGDGDGHAHDRSRVSPRHSSEDTPVRHPRDAPPQAQRQRRASVSVSMKKGTLDGVRERVRQGMQRRRVARLKAALVAMETQVAPSLPEPIMPSNSALCLLCMPRISAGCILSLSRGLSQTRASLIVRIRARTNEAPTLTWDA